MQAIPIVLPSETSILRNKFKYFSEVETAIKNNPNTAEMNFVDAFYWGYLSCLYDAVPAARLLEKVAQICQCEAEQILTTTDKYNFYIQQLQSLSINVDEYIEKKLENPQCLPNLLKISSKEEAKLSEELIEQLRIEEEIEKERIQRIKEENENRNVNCTICLEKLTSKAFLVLDGCGHLFHIECVSPYAKEAIESRKLPIRCPYDDCKNELTEGDLSEFLNESELKKFTEYTLQKYLDQNAGIYTWCPTPDCKFVFEADPSVPEFSCQVCTKHYCLACRVEYHKGMTCKEYQINNRIDNNDILFLDLVKGKKFKQCPKCKFWVEKNQGCDHMTCRCGNQFCYKCGGPYGNCECMRKPPVFRNPPVLRNPPVFRNPGPVFRPNPNPRPHPIGDIRPQLFSSLAHKK